MAKSYVKFVDNGVWKARQRIEVQTLRGDALGSIEYLPQWRQYIFAPGWDTEFSFDCMQDIAAKVKAMTDALKVPV